MGYNSGTGRQSKRRSTWTAGALAALAAIAVIAPLEAQAYVGPGAGITALGSLLALVAGLLFAVVGFVWYPVKRLRRRRKEKQEQEARRT